ncbi:hypothetical protein SESBI_42574 [Sesbania bispinosa]|nr:hypothetical protein SESBI_42574 [Sesbania bispinosa]
MAHEAAGTTGLMSAGEDFDKACRYGREEGVAGVAVVASWLKMVHAEVMSTRLMVDDEDDEKRIYGDWSHGVETRELLLKVSGQRVLYGMMLCLFHFTQLSKSEMEV